MDLTSMFNLTPEGINNLSPDEMKNILNRIALLQKADNKAPVKAKATKADKTVKTVKPKKERLNVIAHRNGKHRKVVKASKATKSTTSIKSVKSDKTSKSTKTFKPVKSTKTVKKEKVNVIAPRNGKHRKVGKVIKQKLVIDKVRRELNNVNNNKVDINQSESSISSSYRKKYSLWKEYKRDLGVYVLRSIERIMNRSMYKKLQKKKYTVSSLYELKNNENKTVRRSKSQVVELPDLKKMKSSDVQELMKGIINLGYIQIKGTYANGEDTSFSLTSSSSVYKEIDSKAKLNKMKMRKTTMMSKWLNSRSVIRTGEKTHKNQCVIDYLLDNLKTRKYFGKIDRPLLLFQMKKLGIDITNGINLEELEIWIRNHGKGISMYVIDPLRTLSYVYQNKNDTQRDSIGLFFQIVDNHIFSIDDKTLRDTICNNKEGYKIDLCKVECPNFETKNIFSLSITMMNL